MGAWAHKMLDDKGGLVFLTSVLPGGKEAFYFLLLARTRRAALFEALESGGDLDLETFGEIVCSGWGQPSEEDKSYMREKYRAKL